MSVPRWEPPSVFDEFRIIRPLGHGAMGQVYLAHDELLDRSVAIKFLGMLEVGDVARERFFIEARAVARLSHPNVVALYRVGEVRRRPFMVSEYVSGTSLDRIDKPLPWERVLKIGIGLARGLASAHRRGVLHRDIKPANVMIGDGDQAKLLDFGLAKLVNAAVLVKGQLGASMPQITAAKSELAATFSIPGEAEAGRASESTVPYPHELTPCSRTPLTAAGAIIGTPLYLAPELWRGEPASRQSDVYAFGVLLYELACGRAPHAGVPMAELGPRAQEEDAAPIASCSAGPPGALAELIDACLSRSPGRRPESGDAICERLEPLVRQPSAEPSSEDDVERFVSHAAARATEVPGRPAVARLGDRRAAVVLCSDIRGFSKFSETVSPEELLTILNRVMDAQARVVVGHGGDVDKFVGDELIAVFQGSEAERRAVASAVEMVAAVHDPQVAGKRLAVGIGVASGEVVYGAMGSRGRMDFTFIGEAVNTCGSVCSAATPDQILVTDAVLRVCAGALPSIEVAPHEPLQVRGQRDPVIVHAVRLRR